MKQDLRFLIIILVVAVIGVGSIFMKESTEKELDNLRKTFFILDTAVDVNIYNEDKALLESMMDEIEADLEYYHELTDKYNEYDGVMNVYTINHSQDPVEVDPILFDLIKLSKDYYEISNGEFNIAFNNVLAVWHEYRENATEGREIAIPYISELEEAATNISIDDVILNEEEHTIQLLNDTTIDLGASAKGYIASLISEKLESNGFDYYIINAGGNVVTGLHPEGRPWKIGLENPNNPSDLYVRVELSQKSAVTSGDYQRFYMYEGTRYHHIIDPSTLYPADHFRAVTVITDDHAVADILSTTLFLMPYEEGLALVESIDNVEAIWYQLDDTYTYSSEFEKYLMTDE